MKTFLTVMALGLVPLLAAADTDKAVVTKEKSGGGNPADTYFSRPGAKLTAQEKAAVAISQRWQSDAANGMKPVAGPSGAVRFIYGQQQANIVCAVLQLCDIELQPGEQVNNMNVGDPRFAVEPAVSGAGPTEVLHLIVKPLDVGLATTLVVTTNRRTYRLNLRSHRTDFMQQVSFIYPEDAAARMDIIKTREAKEKTEQTIPQTKEYLGDLNFKYDLAGSAPWKPVRVYNDGVKTIIQMPTAMAQTEAPTLLVVRKEGGLFSSDDTVMVNYRVQRDRYIVDTVFDKAIMIAGVGRGQDRVTITRGK